MAVPEENFGRLEAGAELRADLSFQSSIPISENAQAKCIPAAQCSPFPHFHSDGYYYGLYPSYKTG